MNPTNKASINVNAPKRMTFVGDVLLADSQHALIMYENFEYKNN